MKTPPTMADCIRFHEEQSVSYSVLMAKAEMAGDDVLTEAYAALSQKHQAFADALDEWDKL